MYRETSMCKKKSLSGFTLIEMLVVVAIMAIIASMATPSFQRQIAQRKIENDMHKVATCFKESQLQAFMYQKDVTVSINGSSSELTCGVSAPIKLSSSVKINSGVNESIVFRRDRMVYPTNTTSNSTNTISDTNGGYSFCIKGYPEQILIVDGHGFITTKEGTDICS